MMAEDRCSDAEPANPTAPSVARYDVVFDGDGWPIVPHFCRQWDDTGGCYGTNPDHGYSFEEAREQVARYHEDKARWARQSSEADWGFEPQPERVSLGSEGSK